MNRILVTGAAGTVGRHDISQLTAVGVPIRALARNPEAAGLPPEAELRGELNLPETMDARLEGIDTVFLVWVVPPATFAPVRETPVLEKRPLKTLRPGYSTRPLYFKRARSH